MRQHWQLISIDNQRTTGPLGQLDEFFWNPTSVMPQLQAPVVPSIYKLNTTTNLEDRGKAERTALELQPSMLLLALPVELLLIIAEDLGKDYLDLLCFSLTCTFLWEITGQSRYHSLCCKLENESWARSRILLVGDFAVTLPKSMLTDIETDELGLDESNNALYRVALDSFQVFGSTDSLIMGHPRVQTNSNLRRELLDANHNTQLKPWISFHWKDFTPIQEHGDHWMLRNLLQREYVSLARPDNIMQALYTLTATRTTHSNLSMFAGLDWLAEGPWAGDRIDLTLVSIHRQEHGDGGDWKDITPDVIQDLEALAIYTGHEGELYLG
ncbi:hypothetical protein F5878DRAFT_182198 [Lentinula raphanica]|uniref:F-box domain-containing protein n=1 Tax=Lentinula raphanica TaxID=153919 RepID=A0AA38UEJ9_9AGAR|nr:hypothetical protein F5878DRAFT_182198 [Lentinula raphanica]